MTSHVILLGDSIFDNAVYVAGGPDVVQQLRKQLPESWQATLKAVDGHMTRDVSRQLPGLPTDASHLVVSVGGNDALGRIDVLTAPATSMAEALLKLTEIATQFEQDYEQMLAEVLALDLPTTLCTIYYPHFPDPMLQKLAVTALTLFNDVILRQAFIAGLSVLDLRLICTEEADYANPIEPAVPGGEKIAAGIVRVLQTADFERNVTEIFS